MIFGGIFLVSVLFNTLKMREGWTLYATFLLGSALGGFMTGRASPHKSIIEPALGAIGILITVAMLFSLTKIGMFLFSLAKGALIRSAIIYGVLGAVGCLGGAIMGEKLSSDQHGSGPFSWFAYSTLINMGALIATFFILMILLLRGEITSYDQFTWYGVGTLIVAALAGGAVTQASAPRRMVLISGLGYFLALGSLLLIAGVNKAPGGVMTGFTIIALGGAFLGVVAARVTWIFVRHFK